LKLMGRIPQARSRPPPTHLIHWGYNVTKGGVEKGVEKGKRYGQVRPDPAIQTIHEGKEENLWRSCVFQAGKRQHALESTCGRGGASEQKSPCRSNHSEEVEGVEVEKQEEKTGNLPRWSPCKMTPLKGRKTPTRQVRKVAKEKGSQKTGNHFPKDTSTYKNSIFLGRHVLRELTSKRGKGTGRRGGLERADGVGNSREKKREPRFELT